MKRYFFVIFVILLFVFSFPIPVDAELSYEQQVKFVGATEEVHGHIFAAKENIVNGNQELATLHLTHPIAELYDDLHAGLKDHHEIDQKVELVLFILKNTNANVTGEEFDQEAKVILDILNEAKSILIKKDLETSSIFKLNVMSDLLEMSKYEYVLGMESGGGLIGIIEFQDSYAFVTRAETILSTINDVEEDKKNKLLLQLKETQFNILHEQPLDEIETQFNALIEEIDAIKDDDLRFQEIDVSNNDLELPLTQNNSEENILSDNSLIPSWVKLSADW